MVAWDVMILMQANPLQGPENRDFLGPEMSTSEVCVILGPKLSPRLK
jgi:hypothetical protein